MDRRKFFASGLAGLGAAALAGNAGAMKFYATPSEQKVGRAVRHLVRLHARCRGLDIRRNGRHRACV